MKNAIMAISTWLFLVGWLVLIKYVIAMVKITGNESTDHKIFWRSALIIILSLAVIGFSGYFMFFRYF